MRQSAQQSENSKTKPSSSQLRENIERVVERIAPMWPLHSYVAVNPFLGFSEKQFEQTISFFKRVNRVNLLMPIQYYLEKIESKEISKQSLSIALGVRGLPNDTFSVDQFLISARENIENMFSERQNTVATISEILDRRAMGNRQISLTDFMIQEISKFCSLYFDLGQAQAAFPFRSQSLYGSWRSFMALDKSPFMMGLKDFDKVLEESPEDPYSAIAWVLHKLDVPSQVHEEYLYRALFDIKGWASYVRHLVWQKKLNNELSQILVELLAIRVLWGYTLFYHRKDLDFRNEWRAQMIRSAVVNGSAGDLADSGLNQAIIFQQAFEKTQSDLVFKKFLNHNLKVEKESHPIKTVQLVLQAVFCIDVRSEPFRRSLEAIDARIETFGVAGFFGVPFKFEPESDVAWDVDHAPALISPQYVVKEDNTVSFNQKDIQLPPKASKLSTSIFKGLSTSGFSYVESFGIMSIAQLIAKSLNFSKEKSNIKLSPLCQKENGTLLQTSLQKSEQAQLAANFLRSIGLAKNFAPIVLIVGHGSESVNNAHAAGLECGACGGHSGDLNAKVMTKILNDIECRVALASLGIEIPSNTLFLPALHNTTSDEVRILDEPEHSSSWSSSKEVVTNWMSLAASRNRQFRHKQFANDAILDSSQKLSTRGHDWSQIRPEWGLAGNSFFIVAPRGHTQDLDLEGKAFLHSYNWQEDSDFKILEQIMTAPMIVTSWINLQYFASTTQPDAFGAGNKTIHNVIGKLGVIEGNSGDLKVGLPMQSVHDGTQFIHKPLRLNVMIAAPPEAVDKIIERHENVRNLVHNEWIHLFSQLKRGEPIYRYSVSSNHPPRWEIESFGP